MKKLTRRDLIRYAGLAGVASLSGCQSPTPASSPPATVTPPPSAPPLPAVVPEFALVPYPEKLPLRLLTDRPPQLETPLEYFKHDLTPNEAFYVRWHLAGIQTKVDLNQFRVEVSGTVESPLSVSLEELRSGFEEVSVVAVNQCSGNQRSLFEPHLPGSQWIHGALGCAKWTGVRLRDLLQACKVRPQARQVTFQGTDQAPFASTPAFVKALELDHAMDGEVLLAYAMNDAPLPILNGFPLRLVVPGWYATYWVKALAKIEVLDHVFDGYWMKTAYRVPDTPGFTESPQQLAAKTVPIHQMSIHSFLISHVSGDKVALGTPCQLEGLATHSQGKITRVEVSTDGGTSWVPANLGEDLGKYAWRRWKLSWTPSKAGKTSIQVRASNEAGQTQLRQQWNRSGFARTMIESVLVEVV